jgi:hypothetical protein
LGHILLWLSRPPPKPNLLIVHFLWTRRPPPKPNIFIVHLLFSWARRSPPKPNILFYLFFIILEDNDCLKGKRMLQSRIVV